MFLSIVLDLTFLITIIYAYLKKNLHVYESWLMFIVISFFHSTKVQIMYLNSQKLIVPKKTDLVIVFWMLIIILVPIITVWYLELLYWFHSFIMKALLTLICISILLGMEKIAILFKVLNYANGMVSTSFLYWILLVVGSIFIQRLFRKFILKEGAT